MAVLTFVFSAGLSGVQATTTYNVINQQEGADRAMLIMKSLEIGNYETWLKLVNPNSRLAKSINEEDFNEFMKARDLARQGKYKEALLLYEDLKLKLGLSDKDIERIVLSLGI